jgi:cell shape-determining protein MreC
MEINNGEKGNNEWLTLIIMIGLSLFLLILNSIGALESVRNFSSYILDPIYTSASSLANSVDEYVETLVNIKSFREDYNDMKIKIAQYEVDILGSTILKQELDDLKKQLELSNPQDVYLESRILDRVELDSLIINLGSYDNIQRGDVVTLGNSFVGIVSDVNKFTSKVRLPISKSSFLQVNIVRDGTSNNILSKAVVTGSSDGIRIENIGMNSDVENGDIVVTNDSKVGDNLILGTLVGLSEDLSATTKSGYVSPSIDYYDLINVFVRINGN